MKKQNIIPIIALLALVSMMIVLVSAETLTGSIISTQWLQTTYTHTGVTGDDNFHQLAFFDIEKSANLISIVRWEPALGTIDAGAPEGVSIPVTVKLCTTWNGNACSTPGATIGSGDLGYQRIFDNNKNEKAGGYQYFVVNTLNVTGLSGDIILYLEYSNADFYNKTTSTYSGGAHTSGAVCFSGQLSGGAARCVGTSSAGTLVSKDVGCTVSYSVTKPASIGIAGSVQKTSGSSKMSLYDGATGVQLANEQLFSSFDYWNFSTVNNTIILGMLNSGGTQVNTSTLFSVTPTPTPTPTPIIPAGYVRNNLYIWDQNDAQISGADVDVFDVENAASKYTTADADGWIIIDTLPYHTVNVYAHYPTAGIYLPNEILGLETGYYGGHNWVLVLYPYVTTPSGFVTLYINTRNYDTKAVLTGVNLQIKNLVTGAITGESTGSTDSVSTVVTNATNYQITGSKSGYISKTININSGEASSKTVVVELSKATVTTAPTSTIPPGGVTPVVTVDPRTPNQKDADMMNQIRDAGPGLIGLAIVATIFGLIKLMTKK